MSTHRSGDHPSPRLSLADARTFHRLAEAAVEEEVSEPEFVAARAAVEVDVDDPAIATLAAAEALGVSPPGWAVRDAAGGVEK